MGLAHLPPLQTLIRQRRDDPTLSAEERAVYENFTMEERISSARLTRYSRALGAASPANLEHFRRQHRRYLDAHQFIEKTEGVPPDTFDRSLNANNLWPDIDDHIALYRLEQVSWVLENSSIDQTELEGWVQQAATQPAAAAPQLQRVVDEWNARRNLYPSFATTHDEIADLLAQADWANLVRDHLGLGHLNPKPGRTEAVLLMRYTVKEVRAAAKVAHQTGFCIPTMLDGTVNPYFFPTPAHAGAEGAVYAQGRAVNLTQVRTESNYQMGVELLHSYLDYRPEHIVRWGVISRPHQANLTQLRQFHLSWLQLNCDRDNFTGELHYV